QDVWVTGLDLRARAKSGARARLTALAGHMRQRALLPRLPLETLALSGGFRPESQPYDFGLVTCEARCRAPHGARGVAALAMLRGKRPVQPRVDPERGGRAFAELEGAWFGGDLHLRPRGEIAWVGPRESDAPTPRALPGYLTVAAGLQVSIAD